MELDTVGARALSKQVVLDLDQVQRHLSTFIELRRIGDAAWVGMAEQVYILATAVVEEDGRLVPAWQAVSGTKSWAAFARDVLELSPATVSAMKAVWETYVVRLGWPPERLIQLGHAKLSQAVARVRQGLDDGELDPGLIEVLEKAPFAEVVHYLQGASPHLEVQANGSSVVILYWQNDLGRKLAEVRFDQQAPDSLVNEVIELMRKKLSSAKLTVVWPE
jgi:hypothetical protein